MPQEIGYFFNSLLEQTPINPIHIRRERRSLRILGV
jgi:hypothetical protein